MALARRLVRRSAKREGGRLPSTNALVRRDPCCDLHYLTDAGVGRSSDWATRIVGLDLELPLLDGRLARYINLDNAATTPPLGDVLDAVLRFLPVLLERSPGLGR